MANSKKHVFFIEGVDNIGKTTTIQTFKNTAIIDNLKYHRVSFSRYPRNGITEAMNRYTEKINSLEEKYNSNQINKEDYKKEKTRLLNATSILIIDDMRYSFTNEDDTNYHINYPDDICNICDKGPLSIYLHQYRSRPDIPNLIIGDSNELTHLKKFFETFVLSRGSKNIMSIIILHNNANPYLADKIIDYSKTIDVNLQTRINSSLNNIVGMIENGTIKELEPIKFYYINIFDDTGKIRKSSKDICKELLSIINKEE